MQSTFFTQHPPMYIGQPLVTPPAPSAAVSYDFSGLGKLSGDAGFVREMQQMFIDIVPTQVEQLQATIEAEDWLTIAQRAHSLKATFGNLRIEPGTKLLKEMEVIAYQYRDKLELLAILRVVAKSADAVAGIFRQQLGQAA
jgi:HPt (histidine-containing phosphotransfer) domain-containing protein